MAKKVVKRKRTNLFITSFILFASIFLVAYLILGISLMVLVNAYSLQEKSDLLVENTEAISSSVADTFIVNNMNSMFSPDKAQLCDSLNTVSSCIDADIYVCDVGGSVIMCKEQAGFNAYKSGKTVCPDHASFHMDDKILQRVYEGSRITKTHINGEKCYVVGTVIHTEDMFNNDHIIGTVFAVTRAGTTDLVSAVIRVFVVIAFIGLTVGFILIYLLTKRMVTPLQQMSVAAKKFAVGDFSYRVNVVSNDELADLCYAFNDMADALDKLEGSRRSFVANVSHELKTPMTTISGFIDGILDGTIPREKQDYYLKIVSDEVRRLSRLVIAMLNMSKIESGDMQIRPKNYNLSDQIFHILFNFEQAIKKKNIDIRGLEDMDTYHITADPDMIYQVIYNLVDNAVKFTNENGYIAVNVEDIGDNIKVSIKNSGDGIKQEELSRVFERFYKIDKSRSLDAKGAGLGLYIVKMMVELHGGRIYARSDSTTEAEFIFTLPKEYKEITKK